MDNSLTIEPKISLAEAVNRYYPKRVHVSTVWRHCRLGVKCRDGQRIRMEHVRCGRQIFTSAAAVQRFFAAVAAADSQYFDAKLDESRPRGMTRTERQRNRAIASAEAELKAANI